MQGKCRDIFIMDYSDHFELGAGGGDNPKQKQLLHMASMAVTLNILQKMLR